MGTEMPKCSLCVILHWACQSREWLFCAFGISKNICTWCHSIQVFVSCAKCVYICFIVSWGVKKYHYFTRVKGYHKPIQSAELHSAQHSSFICPLLNWKSLDPVLWRDANCYQVYDFVNSIHFIFQLKLSQKHFDLPFSVIYFFIILSLAS